VLGGTSTGSTPNKRPRPDAYPMSSRLRLDAYHARWDPIIGPDAAKERYRADKARLLYWRSSLGAGLIVIAGIFMTAIGVRSPLAHDIVAGCFGLLAVNVVLWGVLFLQRRALQNEAASRFVHTKVTSRNFPPSNLQQYERWCARHHVTPRQ